MTEKDSTKIKAQKALGTRLNINVAATVQIANDKTLQTIH